MEIECKEVIVCKIMKVTTKTDNLKTALLFFILGIILNHLIYVFARIFINDIS